MRWFALGLLVSACAAEEGEVVEVGVVNPDAYPVQVPAQVAVGELATIMVISYGDDCTAFESTDVRLTETGADITPYDTRTRGVCDDAAYPIEHPATVTFSTAGTKSIRVHGWMFSPTDQSEGTAPVPVDFEYSVIVE
jgi:hypothetical protein